MKLGIRGKIIRGTVLVALVPVLVLGVISVLSLGQLTSSANDRLSESEQLLTDEAVGSRLEEQASAIADRLRTFGLERINDVQDWAATPAIVDAAREGAVRAEELDLVGLPVEEVEARFADADKELGADEVVTTYLRGRTGSGFSEVFFTEANGYNVASTNPTTDFVQSDEGWWTAAIEDGFFASQIAFDDSAGVYSIELAVRIDGPDDEPLGVLKAVLSVGIIQRQADVAAASDLDVAVVTRDGRLLAETATNHRPDRILSSIVVGPDNLPLAADALAESAERTGGFLRGEDDLAAYSTVRSPAGSDAFNQGFDWIVVVTQPAEAALAPLSGLGALKDDLSARRSEQALLTLALTALALVAAGVVASVVSGRLVRPIVQLRDTADEVATRTLPAVVDGVSRDLPADQLPSLPTLDLHTGDEVEDLATSFTAVQETAARLAAEQARLRRANVARTFVTLGRRNQNLLARQLEFIDQLEQAETDPDSLQNLFRLDNLATRMRRNAESLLVLAGEESPRRWTRPVSLREVFEGAAAEIEDFARVQFERIDDAWVDGSVASDLTHLLAELIENAALFSPPNTPIELHGWRRPDGAYLVSVTDHGLGMAPDQLEELNDRLVDPGSFDQAPVAYLGLFVVGHLARKLGISARLVEGALDGTIAKLEIPMSLVGARPVSQIDASEGDRSGRDRRRRSGTGPQAGGQPSPQAVGAVTGRGSSGPAQPNGVHDGGSWTPQQDGTPPPASLAPREPTYAARGVPVEEPTGPVSEDALFPRMNEPVPAPTPQPPSVAAPPVAAPAADEETTPSGFRRRVRGANSNLVGGGHRTEAGAPGGSPAEAGGPGGSPAGTTGADGEERADEVRSALFRFSSGIERARQELESE